MSEDCTPQTNAADLVKIDVPASYCYLSAVDACLGELLARHEPEPVDENTIYNLRLAVHEVCVNIVEHAYHDQMGGRITVTIDLSNLPQLLVVELWDTGQRFDFDKESLFSPDLDQPRERGYGLFLVRSLVDQVTYEAATTGNRWRLVRCL